MSEKETLFLYSCDEENYSCNLCPSFLVTEIRYPAMREHRPSFRIIILPGRVVQPFVRHMRDRCVHMT